MRQLDLLIARLRGLFRREEVLEDIEEELRLRVDMEARTNVERGMKPDEARLAALKDFGNRGRIRDLNYDVRGGGKLETLWQDLRYGARMLRRNPGFAAVAVISLALGIGANSTVFTFLNSILLRPLPYLDPGRLVILWERPPASTDNFMVLPLNFIEWRDRSQSFEALALTQSIPVNTMMQEGAEQVSGLWITSELFSVFGVAPALGRAFSPEETTSGGDRGTVILSHDFWQRRFAGDPGVVGKTISISNQTCTVIGVMPASFRVASLVPDVYRPMPLDRSNPQSIGGRSFICYGRLKTNVDLASAQSEMSVIAGQLADQYPLDKGFDVAVFGLHQYLVKDGRLILPILMGVVAMVLLIACANLAGLLMTNGAGRRNETGYPGRDRRACCCPHFGLVLPVRARVSILLLVSCATVVAK